MCQIDWICHCASWILWRENINLRVKRKLLTAHGDACAAIMPSSKMGFKLSHIIDAFLVDTHGGKQFGIYLIPRYIIVCE